MKTKSTMIRCLPVLLLLSVTIKSWAQGPYPNQGSHTVCIGEVAPYGVINTPGSTYEWSVIPLAGGNGALAPGNSNLTSVTWNTAGTCNLQVIETSLEGCRGNPVQVLITILPGNTITLTSPAGSDRQSVCQGTAVANITYETTGATGATVTGLPAGVTGVFNGNTVTISGTPAASGTFNYTVSLTGGCNTLTATGTITVTTNSTIVLTSAAGTDNQSVCSNTAIANIAYRVAGATGATVTGLPAGVTGNFAANTVTISGTPTVTGTFTYTVTLTGGCGTVTATGTIVVNPIPVTSPIYHN